MKHSTGEESPSFAKINTVIVHAINQEINQLIMSLNLTENHIKAVARSFEEFYPDEKWKLFMFYVCVGRKITTFQNTKIELDFGGTVFKVDPMSLNELDTHIKHILETNKGKVKYLDQSISEGKEEALDKSYETLVKFVTREGSKLIAEDEDNLKKITFFKNLLEFMNADLCLPRVKISPRKSN